MKYFSVHDDSFNSDSSAAADLNKDLPLSSEQQEESFDIDFWRMTRKWDVSLMCLRHEEKRDSQTVHSFDFNAKYSSD